MSVLLTVSATVVAQPGQGSASFPTETRTLSLDQKRTHRRAFGGCIAVTGTDGTPQPLAFGSITKGRFFAARTIGGEVRFRITTPDGTSQIVPIAGSFMIDSPDDGSEMTAISVASTGGGPELEYLLAGD